MGFEETLRTVSFTVARFSGFAANALLFGLVPVVLVVLRPAFAGLAAERWSAGRRRVAARLEGLVQAALTASALATLVVLVLQAGLVAELHGGELTSSSLESILETSFGRWYLLRLPLVAALAILLVGQVRRQALALRDESRRGVGWWGLWGALALALLSTSTFSGHAAVATPLALSLVNDLVHLAAGAAWFSGIILFAVALPDAWRGFDPVSRLELLTPVVVRFSRLALVALSIVFATGIVNSLLHVEHLADLVETGYGRTLAVKIALFGIILAMGGVNHFVLRNRLERELESARPARAQRLFRKTIAAELVVALSIMAMTGVLVGLARTKEAGAPATGSVRRVSPP